LNLFPLLFSKMNSLWLEYPCIHTDSALATIEFRLDSLQNVHIFFFNSKYWVWNPDRPILIQWSLMCWLRGFRISRPQGSESWSGGKLKNIIASIHM
jgi:hypothetical protein